MAAAALADLGAVAKLRESDNKQLSEIWMNPEIWRVRLRVVLQTSSTDEPHELIESMRAQDV